MTPEDRYHSHILHPKDCSNGLFSPSHNFHNPTSVNNSFHHISNTSRSATSCSSNSSNLSHVVGNGNHVNSGGSSRMGGQPPPFFAPNGFIVGSHKSSGQHDLHNNMLTSKQLTSARGPLGLIDMKEAIGADTTGGAAEELMRSISTGPHKRFVSSGAQDYDNIAGTVRNGVGEDQMSMDFMEHIDSGDYMDHLEGGGVGGELAKKGSRRLGYDQVKALEKAFELENRLEPERKTRLAAQLGLQPRQVAVWFQNRRARWKTKQMERDYALLKNKFEALKADRNKLLQEKDHLQAELARLKGQALVQEGYALSNPRTSNAEQHQQDSPTMASGSLVDDAAPASQSMSKQGRDENVQAEDEDDDDQEEGEGEKIEKDQEGSLKPVSNNVSTPHEQKLHLHNDSLSSTEGSDINNDEAIANSTSKAFHEETDFYAQHWRLPAATAPSQLVYKPTTSTTITTTTTTKNEHEWQEQGENMGPFNMSLDTNWYSW